MAHLSQADRELSTACLTDDSLSSSESCIVVATAVNRTSRTSSAPDGLEEGKDSPKEGRRTRSSLHRSSLFSSGASKTLETNPDITRPKCCNGNTERTGELLLVKKPIGSESHKSKTHLVPDSGRDRRKSTRLESITQAAVAAFTSNANVLGKRSIDALKDGEEILKTIQSKRKNCGSSDSRRSTPLAVAMSVELSPKKSRHLYLPPSSIPGDAGTAKTEGTRPYRSRKKYLASGLYVGQASDFDARLTEKKNQMKRASKQMPDATGSERKYLPMPMYGGKRLLDSGRFFKLPFDVYSPLPPGQPRPDEWRKTQSNRFVGDSVLEWKKLKPLEASCCLCTPDSGCDDDCQNRYMLYECDDSNCNIGAQWCTNRAFADLKERHKRGNKYDIGVDVIKTAAKGFGVRANRTFEPNQIITEYAGEIITQEEAERRMMNEYKNNECYYLMMFDQNMIIDGTRGSIARFVNHSCEPNCRIVKWIVAGKPRMALFAGDEGIMTGEELTYDYNFDPFSQKNVQACKCGAPSCRGVLGPRPKERDSSKASKGETTNPKIKRKADKPINTESFKKKLKSSEEELTIQVACVQFRASNSKRAVAKSNIQHSPMGKENNIAKMVSKDTLMKKITPGRRNSIGKENITVKKAKRESLPKKGTSRIEKRRHTVDALSRTTSNIKRTAAMIKGNSKNGNGGACRSTIEMYFSRA